MPESMFDFIETISTLPPISPSPHKSSIPQAGLRDLIRSCVFFGLNEEELLSRKITAGWDTARLQDFLDSLDRPEKSIVINIALYDFCAYLDIMVGTFRITPRVLAY
jgi:hypothetical protein